ncbi:hypothetical protein SAMN06295912_15030 [Sphingomonas laterariae]|uniref:Uncharacterized protein n=1 Tax=Edaphosphingomonas laterariae TaxID=861865 RepID=A0A239KEX8_9SPHN|nr:hypothetical protein [Sphingomonas laterariae]SNT16179.1 hypothetical protein SAMN06295912_15030 [Sphingomonas laterariae]
MITITAKQAFEKYDAALSAGGIAQGVWNSEQDGRHVACALGVIDPSIDAASKCPASVMPRWLAQMVPWLFDNQRAEDAFAWGSTFYAELARLDGQVPFTVVYDWHANVSCVMGIEAAEKRGRDPEPHRKLQALHQRALNGDRAPVDEWRSVLRNAYADTYAYAYAYADAYADTYAYAYADAYAYAYADADADTYAYAYAYADADADTYAYAYAYAYADADTYAYAYAYKTAINRLAVGLVECMARVPTDAGQIGRGCGE